MENRPIILDHRMQRPEYSSTETITFFFFFFPFPFPPLLFPYPPKEGQNSGVIVALPEVFNRRSPYFVLRWIATN